MKKILFLLGIAGAVNFTSAQDNSFPLTGAPFLRISPDARAGGLGDQGVATSPDAFSQYWNPSKYVFSDKYSGVGISYTPYMSEITNDVFLLNGSFYTFLGEEERSTLGVSFYYFNMGEVDINELGIGGDILNMGKAKPNEFSLDVSYGLKLTDNYSMAVTGRFIRSDLFNNMSSMESSNTKAANSMAIDVTGYYQSEKHQSLGDMEGRMRAGWGIYNVGTKLDYSDSEKTENFLPTTLRLGAGYDFFLDDDNRIGVTLEAAKLMVPHSKRVVNEEGEVSFEDPNKGVIDGMFSSFDSQGMKDITYSLSAEYQYRDAFAFRTGYFHENKDRGGRQYMTVGAGLKYQSFGLDLSYLFTTNSKNSALNNTLRFGLTWNFGGDTDQALY